MTLVFKVSNARPAVLIIGENFILLADSKEEPDYVEASSCEETTS